MRKRFTFRCWNCNRKYTLLREITKEQILTVACPYCNADGVVDLKPYRKEPKIVMRNLSVIPMENEESDFGEELQLPEVLPTQKPE
jgi:DNA-directed RNA polymerase subunit RPC12/RpoP